MDRPTPEDIRALPDATPADPLRILFSGCLTGIRCGFDGTSYGEHPAMERLAALPNVRAIKFCPEDYAFGTPRKLCDLHGGNGFDVLAGQARALNETGEDWTQPLLAAAQRMLELALRHEVHLAVLMDISPACGPQVIYDGSRLAPDKRYQKGPGVCAALLRQNGIKVICQRDNRCLDALFTKLDPNHRSDPTALDHHESEWYRTYFGAEPEPTEESTRAADSPGE